MKEEEVDANITAEEAKAKMNAEEKFISAKIGRRRLYGRRRRCNACRAGRPRIGAGSRGDGSRGNR